MTTLELILVLTIAVLVSAALDQVIPKISLPLIQIALGVGIALLAINPIDVTFNPDFFLLLFIAPILFNDAKEVDKQGLWRNRVFIISLAIGLVIGLTLAVGFALHALVPSVPLAAAFALGAALGPTDAVAALCMRDVAYIDKKERSLLSGEALINDASGVVAFQFAIAAAVTGSFSVLEASTTFAIDFFGGILLGIVLGWLARTTKERMNGLGLDTNTFHVLFDLTLPFVIYLISELVHVSGILAVVAAGLIISAYSERQIGPVSSRLNIVSSNVWSVFTFTLNGIVFVLLGIQLPKAVNASWMNVNIDNAHLIGLVLLLTTILVVVRFAYTVVNDIIIKDPDTGKRAPLDATTLRSALITTLGGPKGAVTLSVIFSTPLLVAAGTPFPQRNLLIFLASGVILCTLLLANFLLPVISPKKQPSEEDLAEEAAQKVEIFRTVIDRLSEQRTRENAAETTAVISSYNDRIQHVQQQADDDDDATLKLHLELTEHLEGYLDEIMDNGSVDESAGYVFVRRLSRTKGYLENARGQTISSFAHTLLSGFRVARRTILHWRGSLSISGDTAELKKIQILLDREAIRYLQELAAKGSGDYPSEVVAKTIQTYQRSLVAIKSARPDITAFTRTTNKMEDVQRLAYNMELEEIRHAQDREEISRETAKDMRESVYIMLVDLDIGLS